jgi:nitrogen fixation NifU-like protein
VNDLDMLYQDVVLDHKRHPRHHGPLPSANREAHGHNPLCGDTVTLRLREAGDRIAEIAFEGQGCAICMASASMMTEAVLGRRLGEARQTLAAMRRLLAVDGDQPAAEDDAEADEAALGKLALLAGVRRFPSRIKCAALAWHALGHCLQAEDAAAGAAPTAPTAPTAAIEAGASTAPAESADTSAARAPVRRPDAPAAAMEASHARR